MRKKKQPDLRFKGFRGDWEEKEFIDLVTRVSTSSSEYGLPRVEYEDIIPEWGKLNKDIYKKESYKSGILFDSGDILFGKLRPYLKNWILSDFSGIAVGDFWVLKPDSYIGEFIYYLMQNSSFQTIANRSMGTKMPRSDWNVVSKTEFAVSSEKKEQVIIGEFFKALDNFIALNQSKYDKLVNVKKAFLRKMFPKEGADVPDLRFKGFRGNWEESNLSSLAEFNPKSELPEIFEYVDLESVVGTELLYSRTETKKTAPSRAQRLARCGDVFYQTVRPYQKNNYMFDKLEGEYVFSTGYAHLRPLGSGYYLFSFLQNDKFIKKVLDNCTGTSYPAINSNSLANINVVFSNDIVEQTKIGEFFQTLDNLITLRKTELDKLKNIKKALLEKMFI